MAKPLRKVWIYEPRLADMSELKKGNLFQVQKATPEDTVDESELLIAKEDARAISPDENGGSTCEVFAGRFIPDENFGKDEKKETV